MAAAAPFVIVQSSAGVSPDWVVTRPLPVPPPAIVTVNGPLRNRAFTVRLWLIVTRQGAVPEHVPLNQPRKAWPALGVAVSVTTVPWLYDFLHPVPATAPLVIVQLIPDGLEVTVPLPSPLALMVRVLSTTAATAADSSGSVGLGESWQAWSSKEAATRVVAAKRPAETRRMAIPIRRVHRRRRNRRDQSGASFSSRRQVAASAGL